MKYSDAETFAAGSEVCEETQVFWNRHIGPTQAEIKEMLSALDCSSIDELVDSTLPAEIRCKKPLSEAHSIPLRGLSEGEMLSHLRGLASENQLWRSYIGLGYHNTALPPVIQRMILENPGWYTQYTPYQPEIAQGRLEALLNFQTMVSDLTGLPVANASLLDEGSAAAEAMSLSYRVCKNKQALKYFVSDSVHPNTQEVLRTRACSLGIELVTGPVEEFAPDSSFFGLLVQYPQTDGAVVDYSPMVERARRAGLLVSFAADLLSLLLLKSPGELGADICFGSSQRFGVPLGFGGPHAAFFSVSDSLKREIPGRIVGVSKDTNGKVAYRLALQTREQHIRRERATSNICTAQVLLAVMAGAYAVYHGPNGLSCIAKRVARMASTLGRLVSDAGAPPRHSCYFDTLRVSYTDSELSAVKSRATDKRINLRYFSDSSVGVALDETTSLSDIQDLVFVLSGEKLELLKIEDAYQSSSVSIPESQSRADKVLSHEIFNSYHSEAEFVRYLERLRSRDLSLTTSMIPLGSCTMKLNAAAEMLALSWVEFNGLHPFCPKEQAQGTLKIISRLEQMLAEITGLPGVSLQPNSGAQGEYTGLLLIRAYHLSRGDSNRRVCLIPVSAHGTNPASAVLAGMEVVSVRCDSQGNVDLVHLREMAEKHSTRLAAMMVTYPSTHGVFEESIRELASIVHTHGGKLYMDGANLNAQVGLSKPGEFGVDVCHMNLHKTFAIPHGGGGPGVGPIACSEELAQFLPGHLYADCGGTKAISAVASAPWGSASVLLIPYSYILMMGGEGLKKATEVAILNANYIAQRLEEYFPVLYRGKRGFVAHECILDLRHLKKTSELDVTDVAKRLMDYGFHAPTVSFPVVETLMVEPTESESKPELDRFCDALISIHGEISEVLSGEVSAANSILKNAPHTAEVACSDSWNYSYSREQAVYPLPWLREHKVWPSVSRIDNAWGDRNLFCSCPEVPIRENSSSAIRER